MNLLRALILIMFSVAMALMTVWERAHATRIRYDIGAMEKEIEKMEKEEQMLRLEVSLLKSPKVIAQRVETMQLGLLDPAGCNSAKKRKRTDDYRLVAMRTQKQVLMGGRRQ